MTGKVQKKPFTKTLDKKRPAHAGNSKVYKSGPKPFNKPGWKKPQHKGKPFKPFMKRFNYKNLKSQAEGGKNVANRSPKKPHIKGYVLEKGDFSFFFKILQHSSEPTTVAKDKETKANELLERTKGKEINYASSKIVSVALQNLFAYADAEHLERFFQVFGENLLTVFSTAYASHALKKLVQIALLRARAEHKVNDEEDLINDGVQQAKRIKSEEPLVKELSYSLSAKFSKEHRAACSDFVHTVNQFVLKNLDELMQTYKNRVMCDCIRSLSGLYIYKLDVTDERYVEKALGNHKSYHVNFITTAFTVPSNWADLLKEMVATLQQRNEFKLMPYEILPSFVISTICTGLANVDKTALDKFGKTLVEDSFLKVNIPKNGKPLAKFEKEEVNGKNGKPTDDEEESNSDEDGDEQVEQNSDDSDDEEANEEPEEQDSDDDDTNEKVEEQDSDDDESEEENVWQNNLPSVFRSKISLVVLENMISIATPKLLTVIFNTLFAGYIPWIIKLSYGHFYIRHVLNRINDTQLFQRVFDLLSEEFKIIVLSRRNGVVAALSDACVRLDANKEAFLKLLQEALQCTPDLGADRPKHLFDCVLVLNSFDVLPDKPYHKISQNGIAILANILQFDKPEILVESLLTAEVTKLVDLFKVQNGNRIAEFVQKSPLISKKSRKNFIQSFVGKYTDLALDNYGSKSLAIIFEAANDTQKIQIAKELLESNKGVEKSALFVRIMHDVLRITCTFSTAPEEWKALWTTEERSEDVKAFAANKVVNKTPKNKKRKLVT